MFVKKTDAELAEFVKVATAEQLAGYYNEVNAHDRKALQAAIEGKASKTEIDEKIKALTDSKDAQFTELNKKLESYGIAIKKLSEAEPMSKAGENFLKKELEKHKENLKALRNGSTSSVGKHGFSIKAAEDMLISTRVTGEIPQAQRLAGLNTVPSRRTRVLDIVSRGRASSNVISWVYEVTGEGGPAVVAEGATKPQMDFDLAVGSASLQKVAAFIKVSEEMIEDIDFMDTQIRNRLRKELMKSIELLTYNAIVAIASAFAAGSFAGTVDNANEADVLVVAMNQIKIAEQEPANFILMHPSDVTKLKLIKASTTDRRYVDRLVMIAGEMSLDGVPIIESTLITVDKYLVGNFDLATLYDKGEVRIEVDRDGNDFIKNMLTILAEWRGVTVIEHNNRSAFVKGDFSDDKAALETP